MTKVNFTADVAVLDYKSKQTAAYKKMLKVIGQFAKDPLHIVEADYYRTKHKENPHRWECHDRLKVRVYAA